MNDIVLRIIFVILESALYLFCLHAVLPKKYRIDIKGNVILSILIAIPGYFFLKDGFFFVVLYNVSIIFIIRFYMDLPSHTASMSVVILYALNMIVSLMTSISILFVFNEILDFRYIIPNNNFLYFIVKVFIMFIVVTLYKRLQILLNKKVDVENANPNLPLLINAIYYISLVFASCCIISYFPVVYSQIIRINYLKEIIFVSIILFYLISFLILYFINTSIFGRRSFKKIKYKSEYDPLTEIYNRATGMQMLKRKMKFVNQNRGMMTLCFIDINNLKLVNDRYGHAAGDRLIKKFASLVKSTLRDKDIFFRYGGDEFIIIFDSCSLQATINVWNRIENKFRDFNLLKKEKFDISVSNGFVEYNYGAKTTMKDLIEKADEKMYHNKKEYKKLKGYSNENVN